MATIRFSSVLQAAIVVWNLMWLSSTLSDECENQIDPGQDLNLMPIQIDCTILQNHTLNIWWNRTDERLRKVVSLDYNCTDIGDMQPNNLYYYVSDGGASTAVDLLPSISNSAKVEPTCYVDGCYDWTTAGPGLSTYIIPTVTCTGITFRSSSYDERRYLTTKMSSLVTPTSMSPSPNLEPTKMQGELEQHIWFVFILVPGITLFLLFSALCITWKREWWCKAKNNDLLLESEPCVDPLAYTESDYCETATIVDPLDIPGHGQNHLAPTTVIYDENLFLKELKQQPGDSEHHSLSGDSDASESGSMPVESDGSRQVERDNLSTCTETVDRGAAVGVNLSDSEEERLLTNTADNTHTVNKGSKRNTKPIPEVPSEHSLSSTDMKTSNEACNDLLQSAEAATMPGHAIPRVLTATGLGDETHCTSTHGATWKSLCDSNDLSTPEYIPSSEYSVYSGNGTSLVVNSSDNDTEINNLVSAEDRMNGSLVKDCHSDSIHEISIPENQANVSNSTNDVQHMHDGVDVGEHCSNTNSPHNRQHQQEKRFRVDYISSPDYTSSVYSSERSAATTTNYFADIEDIADADQCSMQSDLEAAEETTGGLESNSEERIDRHYLKPALLQDVTNCQLHLFLPDDGHHYCTTVNPAETPGSSSSGYVEVSPRQIQNTSVENIYEVMIRQDEPSNSLRSGYVRTMCNERTQRARNYQYETTV